MQIKQVYGKKIYDSRKEPTICVFVKTEAGTFLTSSPSGKSKGKYETPAFVKGIDDSIKLLERLSGRIKSLRIEQFSDLEKVEGIIKKNEIGANTLYALEASILKALAYEQRKQLWQFLNEENKDKQIKMPFPVGNVIGGGLHTPLTAGRKPDFQEFSILPQSNQFSDNVNIMKKTHELVGERLKLKKARGKLNDEGAWSTNLDNESCLEILNEAREEITDKTGKRINIGIDVAASSFYSGLYAYKNPQMLKNDEEQAGYISELINKYNIFYVEDPLNEEDFKNFRALRQKAAERQSLIVGDDLTASHYNRFVHALKNKSIDAVIIKPNQNGSLLEIKRIIDLAKRYKIITIMSHRSGETTDSTIADLAVGWQVDYIKTGIMGEEREAKLKRLMEIEKGL